MLPHILSSYIQDYLQIKSMALITCNYNFISALFLHLFAFLCLILFVNVLSQNNIFHFGYARTINMILMQSYIRNACLVGSTEKCIATYIVYIRIRTCGQFEYSDAWMRRRRRMGKKIGATSQSLSPVSPKPKCSEYASRNFYCDSFDQIKQICISIYHYINRI